MHSYVSVEDALKRADKMIKYPFFAIFFGSMVVAPVLTYLMGFKFYWGLLAGFVLGILFALLHSCYITTKWRIWAFSHVTDVHELKKAAITDTFIPKDGSWQEKLEIRTKADKKALLEIQKRFEEPFKFYDDLSVPMEITIYNSKTAAYTFLFPSLISLIGSVFFLIAASEVYWVSGILFISGCVGLWRFQKLSQREPKILLSNEGIKMSSSNFNIWSDIVNERVEFYQAGQNSRYYFIYQTPNNDEQISLEYLDVTPRRLNHLLYVYRNRSLIKSHVGRSLNTGLSLRT